MTRTVWTYSLFLTVIRHTRSAKKQQQLPGLGPLNVCDKTDFFLLKNTYFSSVAALRSPLGLFYPLVLQTMFVDENVCLLSIETAAWPPLQAKWVAANSSSSLCFSTHWHKHREKETTMMAVISFLNLSISQLIDWSLSGLLTINTTLN